jgi:predicted nuclease with TOPRIM domain
VEDVRRLNQQLAARPGDFTLATNLFLHTSDLANAMFDFSQTAYDNDRETLGRRLAEISGALEQSQQQIETHMLGLAAELAQRVRRLEEENQDLKRKLDEALAKLKEIPRPQ